MSYVNNFLTTDSVIAHFRPIIPTISDTYILSNYAGFLSVSAVTVFELSVKEIFIEFAKKKHTSYGNYVESRFEKINGRIKLDNIRDEHIKPFGVKYVDKFKANLNKKENNCLRSYRYSLKSSYTNLINCRNSFVHEGITTLSINEVIENYERSKQVLLALHEVMKR